MADGMNELTERTGPIRWRDTPEEKVARTDLQIHENDFEQVQLPNPRPDLFVFKMSDRIASKIFRRNEAGRFDLVDYRFPDRLRSKIMRIADEHHLEQLDFITPRVGFNPPNITISGIHYKIVITNDKLFITFIGMSEFNWDVFPGVIRGVKQAIGHVLFGEARKKFVKDKMLTRVGQRYGLDDPLAAKKEIGKFLGGRRKTRKSKKRTTRKTIKH
jgi:hypothetical protein